MKPKNPISTLTSYYIDNSLRGFAAMTAYSFTRRYNLNEFQQILELLPQGYVRDLGNKIELTDLIFSGSTKSEYLLTINVGRNDVYKREEKFDIDVFNIMSDLRVNGTHYIYQWHHIKDDFGKRVSHDVHSSIISDEQERKDMTYATILTGKTSVFTFEEYRTNHPTLFGIHLKNFRYLLNNRS